MCIVVVVGVCSKSVDSGGGEGNGGGSNSFFFW